MVMHREDEDVSEQRQAYVEALRELSEVLGDLSREAKAMARASGRGRPVDLTPMAALVQAMRRAEEKCDLSALDIQTALGEDA